MPFNLYSGLSCSFTVFPTSTRTLHLVATVFTFAIGRSDGLIGSTSSCHRVRNSYRGTSTNYVGCLEFQEDSHRGSVNIPSWLTNGRRFETLGQPIGKNTKILASDWTKYVSFLPSGHK